jgi:hypothetical protein
MLRPGAGERPVTCDGTRTDGLEIGFCRHIREGDHWDAQWVDSRPADGALDEAEVILTCVEHQHLGVGNASFDER